MECYLNKYRQREVANVTLLSGDYSKDMYYILDELHGGMIICTTLT